jgi:carboxypeptidase Q
VAVMIEAMRILNSLGIQPERTIRIGLWGGEEQGFLGSRDYVKTHFINGKEIHFVYFNLDNGAGLIRGIQLQNNEKAVELMKQWFSAAQLERSETVSVASAEFTDHISFADAGLPGFQFIQDQLDYYSIYHSQVDLMDRIPEDDMKKNAYLIAVFAWLAANHDGKFPQ